MGLNTLLLNHKSKTLTTEDFVNLIIIYNLNIFFENYEQYVKNTLSRRQMNQNENYCI